MHCPLLSCTEGMDVVQLNPRGSNHEVRHWANGQIDYGQTTGTAGTGSEVEVQFLICRSCLLADAHHGHARPLSACKTLWAMLVGRGQIVPGWRSAFAAAAAGDVSNLTLCQMFFVSPGEREVWWNNPRRSCGIQHEARLETTTACVVSWPDSSDNREPGGFV